MTNTNIVLLIIGFVTNVQPAQPFLSTNSQGVVYEIRVDSVIREPILGYRNDAGELIGLPEILGSSTNSRILKLGLGRKSIDVDPNIKKAEQIKNLPPK